MRQAIPANPSPVCPAPLATSQTDSTCGRSSCSRFSVGLLVWTSLLAYRSAKASNRLGEEMFMRSCNRKKGCSRFMRAFSSSACLWASHPSWRSTAPPQPWRGSWPVRRAPQERCRCPLHTWGISVCSFCVIIDYSLVFVTFALGGGRGRLVRRGADSLSDRSSSSPQKGKKRGSVKLRNGR